MIVTFDSFLADYLVERENLNLDQFALHLLHVVQLFGQVIDRRLLLIEDVLVRVSHLLIGRQMLLELSVELLVFRLQIFKVILQD